MQKPLSFLSNFRQHSWFLLAGTLLMVVIIYSLSIRRTLAQYQQFRMNQSAIERARTASGDIDSYRAQLVSLQHSAQQAYDRELLLATITDFCRDHQLLVHAFPAADRTQENGHTIVTNHIEIEGRYRDMVALVYLLEQEARLGSVSSLHFYTLRDRVKKKEVLRGQIVLRNLDS